MKKNRISIDRRSNINRRQMGISADNERRRKERRFARERRHCWVRSSEWSSMNLEFRNRCFWDQLK